MAAAKKKPAPKAQRVSNAKGLYENVGKYKDKKSLNLRDKQLGKKGVAAAKKRTVSISNTKYNSTGSNKGLVTGPAGNPLTGKVDMGGGNMAVYKDGKRVTARTAKKATPPRGGGGSGSGSGGGSSNVKPLTAAQKAAIARDKSKSQGTSKPKGSGSSAGETKVARGSITPRPGAAGAAKASNNFGLSDAYIASVLGPLATPWAINKLWQATQSRRDEQNKKAKAAQAQNKKRKK